MQSHENEKVRCVNVNLPNLSVKYISSRVFVALHVLIPSRDARIKGLHYDEKK